MAKTPEELEQIHEHNRKVLRELQFDSTKWLPVPRAIRALVPVFGPALQAAAELFKLMRSGAIPTATRWCRWRDGLQSSHLITRYPPPADWDAASPESLIMDFREISEGDGNVVRCWDYVDLRYFNRWLSALPKQARRAAKARRERAAKKPRHAGGTPSPSKQEETDLAIKLAAQELKANSKLTRDQLYDRLFGPKDKRALSLKEKKWGTRWTPGRFRNKVRSRARERAGLNALALRGRPRD